MNASDAAEKVDRPRRRRLNAESVGRPKTRKPKPGELMHLTVNLDGAIILALDEEAGRRSAERRGPAWTRTDVVRDVLTEWFESRSPSKRSK
jgi:hypothetical protein